MAMKLRTNGVTIEIQIVIFNSSHYVSEAYSSYILGIFYLGVAAAAFMCDRYKIFIAWDDRSKLAYIHTKNATIRFNLQKLLLLSVSAVIGTVYCISWNEPISANDYILKHLLVYFFVFLAAFFYEVISLALLDRLGYEEKNMGRSGMIMRTYGLMGVGSAISLWVLSFIDHYFASSIITLLICVAFTTIFISKRKVGAVTDLSLQVETMD
jgi:hypothetical protein